MTTRFEQFRPDPGQAAPLYLQLVDRIAGAVASGQLGVGQALPPERQLCEALDVSRVTLRKAIEVLIGRGLVESRHGSGTFVARRVVQPLTELSSFSADMRARGWTPSAQRLACGVHRADPAEAAALGLTADESVLRLVRIRLADGLPMALERATVPARVLPDPGSIGDSLYAALQEMGVMPVRAVQHLRAAAAAADDAELLQVPPGSPVMHTTRQSFLPDDQPIEFTRSVYRGDRYDFVAEMR